MHKLIVLSIVFVLLFLLNTMAHGQGISGFFYPLRDKVRQPKPFSYPRRVLGDTVYILNGKQTVDVNYVRSVLSSDYLLIDTLAIGLLTKKGQRETIINYKKRLESSQVTN